MSHLVDFTGLKTKIVRVPLTDDPESIYLKFACDCSDNPPDDAERRHFYSQDTLDILVHDRGDAVAPNQLRTPPLVVMRDFITLAESGEVAPFFTELFARAPYGMKLAHYQELSFVWIPDANSEWDFCDAPKCIPRNPAADDVTVANNPGHGFTLASLALSILFRQTLVAAAVEREWNTVTATHHRIKYHLARMRR